jgi:hypothetical protein
MKKKALKLKACKEKLCSLTTNLKVAGADTLDTILSRNLWTTPNSKLTKTLWPNFRTSLGHCLEASIRSNLEEKKGQQ